MLNIITISVIILFKLLSGTDMIFKIITTIVMIIINLILGNVIYSMGLVGPVTEEISNVMRPMILFTLFPINMILMSCPLAMQINKWKLEELDQKKFSTRVFICLIIDIAVLIIEFLKIKTYLTNYIK